MKEAKLQSRPAYKLLTQTDIVSYFHMQMPRWLFFDPKYRQLSLETKVAYTFLLNRFQLSKLNGWINADNEVFIIYPREKLAEEMGISYRKAIACCKELLAARLIWEHRVGRGNANRIYMAAVTLSDDSACSHDAAPFSASEETQPDESASVRDADSVGLVNAEADAEPTSMRHGLATPAEDMQNAQSGTCGNGRSKDANTAPPDLPIRHPNKKDFSNKDFSQKEIVSQSVFAGVPASAGEETDLTELNEILEGCDLDVLAEHEAGVFQNAITRLYFSKHFRVSGAVLPQTVIRSQLHHLDGMALMDAREKLRHNLDKTVKNSTTYIMATLLNNIWEVKSDLMVDPFLNTMNQ